MNRCGETAAIVSSNLVQFASDESDESVNRRTEVLHLARSRALRADREVGDRSQ